MLILNEGFSGTCRGEACKRGNELQSFSQEHKAPDLLGLGGLWTVNRRAEGCLGLCEVGNNFKSRQLTAGNEEH